MKQTENKFPFAVGAIVRVFENRGMQFKFMMELREVRRCKIIGVDTDGKEWEVTWVSETNEQLYERTPDGGRTLVAKHVQVFAAETEVD